MREITLTEQTSAILFSSLLTSCLVTPFDVVKTRMQIQIFEKHNNCFVEECITCTGEKQIKFNSTFVILFII
jgi:hypothetical protein